MSLVQFDIASLAQIDEGRISEALAQAMRRVESDLRDRPGHKGKRKVVLEIVYEPGPSDSNDLESVDVTFNVKETMPKRESRAYNMIAARHGLMFNENVPEDAKQTSLVDEVGKKVSNAR